MKQRHNLEGIDGDKMRYDMIIKIEYIIQRGIGKYHQDIPVCILIYFASHHIILNTRRISLANRHQRDDYSIEYLELIVVI
jgi:hypothetical protein